METDKNDEIVKQESDRLLPAKLSRSSSTDSWRYNSQGIHWLWGTSIMVHALVGSGLLNFPFSVNSSGGFLYAVPLQLILIAIIYCSMASLAWMADLNRDKYYQDIVYSQAGNTGRIVCAIFMMTFSILVCIGYSVAYSQQMTIGLKAVLGSVGLESDSIFINRTFIGFTCSFLIVLPFCCVRYIDRLKYPSAFAQFAVLLALCVIIYKFFTEPPHETSPANTSPESWSAVVLAVPSFAQAYMYDLTGIAVYGRMKQRTMPSFIKASGAAIVTVFILYNLFALIILSTFGSDVQADFLTGYRANDLGVAFVQVAYSFKLALEFPVYQFHFWSTLRTFLRECGSPTVNSWLDISEHDTNDTDWLRFGVSFVYVLIITSLSIFVPSLNSIVPLSGCIILQLQLLFPGFLILMVMRNNQAVRKSMSYPKRRAMNIFGLFILILGILLGLLILGDYIYKVV